MSGILTEIPRRDPLSGTFELTLRCNLKCKMCLFRHADSEFPQMAREELSAEEWIDMARQAAEAGTLNLLITGGEPMFRKDFCEIWEGIYQYGFVTELYTNATLVDDRIMETLRKYPPHSIGVTLYGASAESYEKVCGNGAMYERALAGMHRLQELPSDMSFRATVIQDNLKDAEAMERLVGEEFGLPDSLTTSRIVTKAVRGACAKADECRLEPEDNVKLMHLRARMRMKEILGEHFDERHVYLTKPQKTEPDSLREAERVEFSLLGCKAGMSQYTICYDGKLQGCQMLGAFQTDARAEGLQAAWERFPETVVLPERNSKCKQCEDADYCTACAATVYAETGHLDGWPEYLCRDTAATKTLLRESKIRRVQDERKIRKARDEACGNPQ